VKHGIFARNIASNSFVESSSSPSTKKRCKYSTLFRNNSRIFSVSNVRSKEDISEEARMMKFNMDTKKSSDIPDWEIDLQLYSLEFVPGQKIFGKQIFRDFSSHFNHL
jgi:hypothetical protein